MLISLKRARYYFVAIFSVTTLVIANVNAMESTQSGSWAISDELCAVVLLNVTRVSGMGSSPELESWELEDELLSLNGLTITTEESSIESGFMREDEFIMVDDFVITAALLFQYQPLLCLIKEISQVCDVGNCILFDLFWLQMIAISDYLKAIRNKPEVVLLLIDHLHKNYGHNISVALLGTAFKNAGIWIGDIRDWKSSCLDIASGKNFRDTVNLDCIKIILEIAQATQVNFGQAGDMVKTLLRNDGFIQVLNKENASCHKNHKIILDIIQCYAEKYQLVDLLLQLKDL